MAELFDGIDLKAALAQVVEKHAVSAGRKAVAVREDDAGFHALTDTKLSKGLVEACPCGRFLEGFFMAERLGCHLQGAGRLTSHAVCS
jgi:hypothetical protein